MYWTRDVDDHQNDRVKGSADNVRAIVDPVATDMLLRIDANPQHKMRRHYARERGRRDKHERDNYLKPHRLFHDCGTKDGAYPSHHTRNRSGAHKAV